MRKSSTGKKERRKESIVPRGGTSTLFTKLYNPLLRPTSGSGESCDKVR